MYSNSIIIFIIIKTFFEDLNHYQTFNHQHLIFHKLLYTHTVLCLYEYMNMVLLVYDKRLFIASIEKKKKLNTFYYKIDLLFFVL